MWLRTSGDEWKFTDQFNNFKDARFFAKSETIKYRKFLGFFALYYVHSHFFVFLCNASGMVFLSTFFVGLELCKAELFCSSCPFLNQSVRDVFGLFQAIFNLSLSQQVWDNLRKNRRRPLKTLDQSVWGGKKRKKC